MLPTVLDNCMGTLLPAGPPVVSAKPVCEGTRTYTYTYTDCEGNSHPWVFTYTVEREDFTPPAPGGATVACPDQTDTPPMLPTVLDNCMGTLLPVGPPVVSAKPVCEGTRTYTYTYTDCEGNSHPWVFTYTVEREDFTPPAPGGATVACPDQTDTPPMLPTVLDNCMGTLLPVGPPVVSAKPVCEGTRTYTYTYTDCEGNSHPWVFTYTVEREDFTPPAPGGATVACPDQTDTPPMLPTVLDNCMGTLLPAGPPVVSAKPVCEGTRTYTYTYTDCEGNSHPWVFTYTVEREDFTPPAPEEQQ
jgi:hypothetical protein